MSHSHEDRVAQHDHRMCDAYGCTQLGTMATSTTGGNEWWCILHFGKDAGQLQRLTVEMNQREWLAHSITDMRRNYGTESWPLAFKTAQHEFAMHQRTDLQHKRSDESVWKWIARLEGELQGMCQAEFTKPAKQQSLPDEPFQRLQLTVPECA